MVRRAERLPALARALRAPQSSYAAVRGYRYARGLPAAPPDGDPVPSGTPDGDPVAPGGALEAYFDAHTEGPGMLKWRHYFDAYERHLGKFVGREMRLVEIGVFGGGSLGMWREYFGERSRIYGVDRDPACRMRGGEGIEIVIGDQASASFWAGFRRDVPPVDVVIDDGGHQPHQQIATLEALLPHLRPGGVYVCEDIHGAFQPFHSYVDGLTRQLHEVNSPPRGLHQHVKSVHVYPGLIVIEKPDAAPTSFEDAKRGTDWRPFW